MRYNVELSFKANFDTAEMGPEMSRNRARLKKKKKWRLDLEYSDRNCNEIGEENLPCANKSIVTKLMKKTPRREKSR